MFVFVVFYTFWYFHTFVESGTAFLQTPFVMNGEIASPKLEKLEKAKKTVSLYGTSVVMLGKFV